MSFFNYLSRENEIEMSAFGFAEDVVRAVPNSVLCCECGVVVSPPNKAFMCATCLQTRFDITEAVVKSGIVNFCKGCGRYQNESARWVTVRAESRELLALLLKKTKGLKTVKIVDAGFVWTEPHSRRLKTKLKVQKEVLTGVTLQQTFVCEFIEQSKMCEECHRKEADMTWKAVVQVRQKVDHKRTFLFLEQLILKHDAAAKASNIDPMPEGIDFYFGARNEAIRFCDFLESVIPTRKKAAKKIISADLKSNTASFNHTLAVEIVPVCKDDLVCFPKAQAAKFAGGSQFRIFLCTQVGTSLRFVDPCTLRMCELNAVHYWNKPFKSLISAKKMIEFTVLDVQDGPEVPQSTGVLATQLNSSSSPPRKRRKGRKRRGGGGNPAGAVYSKKHRLVWVEVARVSDLGVNDTRYSILSHLGNVLKPGDSVLGYDLTCSNFNDDNVEDMERNGRVSLPDIVLVRKHYPRWRAKQKNRAWKLRSLAAEAPNKPGAISGANAAEKDYEMFLRDLEEDEEMRSKVQLYRRDGQQGARPPHTPMGDSDDEAVEEDAPAVPLDELLGSLTVSPAADVDTSNHQEGGAQSEEAAHVSDDDDDL